MEANFISIDIETCNCYENAPCVIRLTEVKHGEVKNNHRFVINPEDAPYEGLAYTSIDLKELREQPTLTEQWDLIKSIIGKYEYMFSFGEGYDFRVLKNILPLFDITMPDIKAVPSKNLVRRIYPDFPMYNLKYIIKELSIEAKNRSDTSAEIVLKCLEKKDACCIEEVCHSLGIIPGSFSGKEYTPYTMKSKRDVFGRPVVTIIPDATKNDPNHLLYESNVVFTGKLSFFKRDIAHQIVADIGGFPQKGVNKDTDFLVVGEQDYRVVGEDGMSGKQEKAVRMKEEGHPLEIISETEFIDMFDSMFIDHYIQNENT